MRPTRNRLASSKDRTARVDFGRPRGVAGSRARPRPHGGEQDPLKPEETVALGELTGRLAKSEWGLTGEQSELVLGALLRLGHLLPLEPSCSPFASSKWRLR